MRCEDVGLAEADDQVHLDYATLEGRVLITNDDDFLALDRQWREQGKYHAGIMYCLPHVQGKGAIGIIVKECVDYAELIASGAGTVERDIVNTVIYVG